MKRNELKKVLKPLIKECIKEVIFEEGVLSGIISETIKGVGTPITASPPTQKLQQIDDTKQQEKHAIKREARLTENRKKLLNAVGSDAYNGVDIFEGTTPTSAPRDPSAPSPSGALSGIDPSDSGVDISGLFGNAGRSWKSLI